MNPNLMWKMIVEAAEAPPEAIWTILIVTKPVKGYRVIARLGERKIVSSIVEIPSGLAEYCTAIHEVASKLQDIAAATPK